MSSTTVNKSTQTSPEKTKKRSSGKKVAKTNARKTPGGNAGVKKKATTKKAVSKKTAAKMPATGRTSKKATAAQQQDIAAPGQTSPAPANSAAVDSNSLSWMSARAASALRAVKASQAEKGQAVLARTRKQTAEDHIDDDSLMRIAAEMPIDNEALVEFSDEQPFEEYAGQADAVLSAPQPVADETGAIADTPEASSIAPETAAVTPIAAAETSTSPAQQAEVTLPTPPPPQQPARRAVGFQPALAAGLIFAALLLGYYFWPEGNDSSNSVATQESSELEVPVAATESEPSTEPQDMTGDDAEDVATAPVAEPGQESAGNNNGWTPSFTTPTWEPSVQPQAAAEAPAAEPEPTAADSSPLVTQAPPPEQAAPPAQPVQAAPPAQPVQAAPPAQPVQAAPPAQPAQAPPQPVPAQTGNRAPAQGYYPQQPRPAYPQYYYR